MFSHGRTSDHLRRALHQPVRLEEVVPRAAAVVRRTSEQPLHRANFTGLVLDCIEAKFCKKYAFESSRRDLHNALLSTALKSHLKIIEFSKKIAKKFKKFANFAEFPN